MSTLYDTIIFLGIVAAIAVLIFLFRYNRRGLRTVGTYGDLKNTREESKRKAKELTATLAKDRERLHAEHISRKAKAIVENDQARDAKNTKPVRTRRVRPTASSPRSSYSSRRSDDGDDYARTSIYTSTISSPSSSSDWGSSTSSSDFGGGSSGGGGDSGSW